MASRGRPSKQGTPFDRLIKLQCQKAVVSKSSVGGPQGSKWGSFSTVRPSSASVGSSSDLKRGSPVNPVTVGAPKPKKFFKSREAVAPAVEDNLSFTDSSVSQIVPIPPKRVLKPLEPKPPAQQIQVTSPPPTKSSSKFFSSKPLKLEKPLKPEKPVKPEKVSKPEKPVKPVPDHVFQPDKPRRAAAERVSRQDYAESDSDESSSLYAPPISKPVPQISKPAPTKTNSRTLVSKGKPSATLIHQQQQQQERRASVHKRTLQVGGKTIGNSEESNGSEESGGSESEQISPPKVLSPPIVSAPVDLRQKNVAANDSEIESNGGYSDAELMADPVFEDEPAVEASLKVPPLKVPPLKLIFKVSQLPVPEKVAEKKSSRKGRTRYNSDQSEHEIVDKKVRTRLRSNTSENEIIDNKVRTRLRSNTSENEVEVNKARSRYTSNNSENGGTERVTRNRLKSNTSETEVPVTSKARTRYPSNNSENELVLDYSNSRSSRRNRHEIIPATKVPSKQSSNSIVTETFYKNVEERFEDTPPQTKIEPQPDDEPAILRHPSRARTYGSRSKPSRAEPQNSAASESSTIATTSSANALRLTRRNPLPQIEEEASNLSIPSESSPNNIEPLVKNARIKPMPKVEEVEIKTIVKEENSNSVRGGIRLKLTVSKPVEVIPVKIESQDQPGVDISPKKSELRNWRNKPLAISPDILPQPNVDKPEVPLSPKPEMTTVSDLNDVPDVEEEPASLTRAQTVATDTNVAAELKYSFSQRNRYKREESSSQPLLESSKPSTSTSVQKRSIFKSKASAAPVAGPNGGNGNKKGLSLYKHKWNSSNEPDDFRSEVLIRALTADSGPATSSPFDDDFDGPGGDVAPSEMNFNTSKLVRVTSDANKNKASTFDEASIVSVKCHKAQKEYFTVIKNVKKAHQIQDSGEFQEFNDDVDYILGGLGAKNSLSTRCLSTVTLASKCMEAPFRMHLRAHGTVTQFFSELKDAPKNPSLALCAATVLFVLSQDRLNMDLDRDSLELMLNLLDTDSRIKDALDNSGMNKKELEKNKQKVQELCGEMKKKGHAANLSLEDISADHLSMETLLSLTSKRAGEWFKEELRELGGLDHLVNTMSECVSFLTVEEISLWTDPLHTKLKKAGRVLKVLESVTSENEENCDYLLDFNKGQFLDVIHTLFKFLDEEVPLNSSSDLNDRDSVSQTLRDSLFDVIKVYINLVHDYKQIAKGSVLACQRSDLFDIVLHCLFVLPESLPDEKRFDVLVLTLTFVINLVEHSEENREKLMRAIVPQRADALFSVSEKQTATEAMVQLFLQNEENARNEESKTDQILDGVNPEEDKKENKQPKSREEVIDETVAQLLHKAGRHMEDTLIASYITLIIGYLILDNKEHEAEIREILPEKNFVLMVTVLKKFFNFMNLTASATLTSSRGIKATERIIKYLEQIDKKEEKKEELNDDDNYDDVTLFDVSAEDGESTSYQNTPLRDDGMYYNDDFGKL